jgi:hypothetical protein
VIELNTDQKEIEAQSCWELSACVKNDKCDLKYFCNGLKVQFIKPVIIERYAEINKQS